MAVTFGKELDTSAFVYTFDDSAGTFSGNLTNTSNFDYFTDDATVGDIIYVAPNQTRHLVMGHVTFFVGTAISGTGIVITAEYFNGSVWTTIPDFADDTVGFTVTGENKIFWDTTKIVNWTLTSINGQNRAWVRFRISSLTTITEGGAQSTQKVLRGVDNIFIEDFSSSTPADSADIYAADKAGTVDLMARSGLTTTDGGVVNNTIALAPADEKVLGGGKNDLFLTVTNYSGFTDVTVQLSGEDCAGGAQTEDIVITGNGTNNSTKLWTALDSTQITAVTGAGSLDYTVTQGQWGIVWSELQWVRFDRPLTFTNTFFTEISKQWYLNEELWHVTNGTVMLSYEGADSFVEFGTLVDLNTKETGSGVQFFAHNATIDFMSFLSTVIGGIRYYSCCFDNLNPRDCNQSIRSSDSSFQTRVWNSSFNTRVQLGFQGGNGDSDVFNCMATNDTTLIRRADGGTGVERITGVGIVQGIWYQGSAGYVKNVFLRGVTNIVRMEGGSLPDCYIVNLDKDGGNVTWPSVNTAILFELNQFDIKIVDFDGSGISGAKITLQKAGDVDIEGTTDSNGNLVSGSFVKISGEATSTSSGKLVDSAATFQTDLVRAGQFVLNITDSAHTYVVSVDSETELTLRDDIFVSGEDWFIETCDLEYGFYDRANLSVIQDTTNWTVRVDKSGYWSYEEIFTIQIQKSFEIRLERRRRPSRR